MLLREAKPGKDVEAHKKMTKPTMFGLPLSLPVEPAGAGLFVSAGIGSHPVRVVDSYEIILVDRGCLEMFEEDRRFSLGPGDALLLTPGRQHGGAAPYPRDLAFYWLHFHLRGRGRRRTAAAGTLSVPPVVHLADPNRLRVLFRRYLDDRESGAFTPLVGSLLVLLMLAEMAADPGASTGAAGLRLAQLAKAHIDVHAADPGLGAGSLARALGCNPDYLGRVFRQCFGQTLTAAIHRRRLQLAADQLLTTPRTIAEVAADCGYADMAFFRKRFRRLHGVNPAAFRRLYRQWHTNSR
jgi:AraC-like DNA-binding protein